MKRTTDAVKIMESMIGDDPELHQMYAEAKINAHVAQLIYDARIEAGLTQAQLAELVGTKQSVISRLEDGNYEGHSLSMLNKIAKALHQEVKISLVPVAVPNLTEVTAEQPHA